MSHVALIEYQGRVDENGKALGHGPKVLNEYFNFIKDDSKVSVYAPKEVLNEFSGSKVAFECKVLPKKIVMGKDKTIAVKIANKLNMFKNISLALKHSDADTLWFYNVEYYFFLYIFLHKRINKKIVCTMFLDGYRGGLVAKIKQFIFEKAQKKIDLIISTGKQLKFKNCKYKYIPDYYYDDEKFGIYKKTKKENIAVCLGTMGRGKQLRETVEAFNRMGYRLIIAGRFYDKELLKELKDIAKDNIVIRDEYLSYEEYLSILGNATYTVLPYSPSQYDHQTSGVMQEAVFLDTIPVSFNEVLDGNGISGVGFNTWEELDLYTITEKQIENCRNEYARMRNEEFSYEKANEFYKKNL